MPKAQECVRGGHKLVLAVLALGRYGTHARKAEGIEPVRAGVVGVVVMGTVCGCADERALGDEGAVGEYDIPHRLAEDTHYARGECRGKSQLQGRKSI